MRGHNAHAETVGAAFSRGNASLVDVIAGVIGCAVLIQHRCRGIADVAVADFAVMRFHTHMLRIECEKVHSRRPILSRFGFAWVPEIELREVVTIEAAIARE